MSIADAPCGTRRDRARRRGAALVRSARAGFTYIEIVATLAILSLMSLAAERAISTLHDSERYLAALRLAAERGQALAYAVRDIAASSRKLYGADAVGESYLDALDLGPRPLAPGARLPLLDEVGPLAPDIAGVPATGNVLLLVRESDPAPAMADPATRRTQLIDTYRFVCVYPTVHTRTVVNGSGPARDLVVWRSRPYPSRAQIMAVSNPVQRAAVITDLATRFGHDLAWDPLGVAGATFHVLDAAGTMSATPEVAPLIEADPELSEGGRLVYANLQLAATSSHAHVRRSVLGKDDPALWTPHGFELKVVGPSAARTVWIHLVVESQAGHGRSALTESTLIASTSDL